MLQAIIPAAGQSTRFKGVRKELLPIWYNGVQTTPLAVNIEQAQQIFNVDHVVIVSRAETITAHFEVASQYKNVSVVPYCYDYKFDLLGSIASGIQMRSNNMVLLPDTVKYIENDAFKNAEIYLGWFGVFNTSQPERFSTIVEGRIHTKQSYPHDNFYKAWGIVKWPVYFNRMLIEMMHQGRTYDDVFNVLIQYCGLNTFPIQKYYDVGTFKAYAEYMMEYQAS